jgi:hypothetical protein
MTVFWVVAPCGLVVALTMEAVSSTEASVNFNQTTRCNKAEDSHLHTRSRENLKSRSLLVVSATCTKWREIQNHSPYLNCVCVTVLKF